jgi:hypothetical protein
MVTVDECHRARHYSDGGAALWWATTPIEDRPTSVRFDDGIDLFD